MDQTEKSITNAIEIKINIWIHFINMWNILKSTRYFEILKEKNTINKKTIKVVDIGSFVSPKAIPQLSDTSTIIDSIDLSNSNSELLVILANKSRASISSKV